jgi:hypothetical protein
MDENKKEAFSRLRKSLFCVGGHAIKWRFDPSADIPEIYGKTDRVSSIKEKEGQQTAICIFIKNPNRESGRWDIIRIPEPGNRKANGTARRRPWNTPTASMKEKIPTIRKTRE